MASPRPDPESRAIDALRLEPFDERLTLWLSRHAITLLRLSLALVFLWFGAIKLVPGWSPATGLVGQTIEALSLGLIKPGLAVPIIAVWEVVIGLGLLTGKLIRTTLLLLALQMVGTLTPLVLFPDQAFTIVPIAPTLEGQYILKNAVLIAGALVVGSTVRHQNKPRQIDVS